MRVMVIVKANEDIESGRLPEAGELEAMGRYNEELVQAGVLLAADGLHASSAGKRVRFADSGTTVVDGPFAETKELVAGFWIWQVSSMDEAVEWVRRAPFPEGQVIEVRRVFEAEDFGDSMTPELRDAEQRIRDEAAAQQ